MPIDRTVERALGGGSVEAHRLESGRKVAGEQIDIGDGERTTATVASWARIGTRALGTDFKRAVAHAANRTTARGHAVDGHTRRCDGGAGDARFAAQRNGSIASARDIGTRAAHVKSNRASNGVATRDTGHRARAAGGTGEQRVARSECRRTLQHARTGEDERARLGRVTERLGRVAERLGRVAERLGRVAERLGRTARGIDDELAQNRRNARMHACRFCSREQPCMRRNRRRRNHAHAWRIELRSDLRLAFVEQRVRKRHHDAIASLSAQRIGGRMQLRTVRAQVSLSARERSFADRAHCMRQRARAHWNASKQILSRLVTDLNDASQSVRDQHANLCAASLEQRVGSARC